MKKDGASIAFKLKLSQEKLSATRQFMREKGLDFDAEMNNLLVKLYQKHVPKQVRSYIEGVGAEQKKEAGKGKKTTPTPPEIDEREEYFRSQI